MLTVNLWDTAFAHLTCSVHSKTAKRIRYVRSRSTWDGITLITDDSLTAHTLDSLRSRITIGWLLEPREYKPGNYERAASLLPRLDMLLTHDQRLLDSYPDKVRRVPFGGCWIPEAQWGMRSKGDGVCQIVSGKGFMPGHLLRHEIARDFKPLVCSYGSGVGTWISYEERAACLIRYPFAIVVENSRAPNFWTEKIADCFAVGTIPIYHGCPNLTEFGFDMSGVIPFESIDELPAILDSLDYARHREGVEANLQAFRSYEITDDWIAEHILEAL